MSELVPSITPLNFLFSCPFNMSTDAHEVLSGMYDLPALKASMLPEHPVVLDIGANVGAFSMWARVKFPGCEIHAFEPHPGNFELLQSNLKQIADEFYTVTAYPMAVSDYSGTAKLFNGKNNTGEASLYKPDVPNALSQDVKVISGAELPPADVIKLDTEGSEYSILSTYQWLDFTKVVMFEFHSLEAREQLGSLLTSAGFELSEYKRTAYEFLGVQIWTKVGLISRPAGVPANEINVLIGLPAYGGLTHCSHNRSIIGLVSTLNLYGVRHDVRYLENESLIQRARNLFGNMTLDKDANGRPYTHLLFLDVDIGFNPENIMQMIGADKDIVALPYTAKGIDWNKVVKAVRGGVTDGDKLIRLCGRPIINTNVGETISFKVGEPLQFPQLGTGLLLIKRKVFEKMSEDPERLYKLMPNERLKNNNRDYAYDFFQTGVNSETRYYDSEDYRFCLDARKLGFETWLLPWAITSHTGSMTFWMDIPAQAESSIDLLREAPPQVSPDTHQPTTK